MNTSAPTEKRYWHCPIPGCGYYCDAVPRPGGGVFIGCIACRERDGLEKGEWLKAAADALTGDAKQAGNLLSHPESILGPPVALRANDDSEPPTLPSPAALAGLRSRLLSDHEALGVLLARGLTESTVRRRGLGWDGDAYLIPCPDAHRQLANIVEYKPGRKPKYKGLANVKARLYRPLPLKESPWLLIEGLLDCLLARQEGIPEAVTSTHGKGFPASALPLVQGRHVAVAYDAEPKAEQAALSRVEQLNAAGAVAWRVRLSKLDLPHKGDLTDFFQRGGTPEQLYEHINDERSAGADD